MFMKHFSFNQFFHSTVAESCGILNLPDPGQEQFIRGNIILLVDHVLDPIRDHVRLPIIINSGFRCPSLNELVGGKDSSQHLTGQAADFTVIGMTVRDHKDLAYWCADNIDFNQLIVYSKRKFIHISYVSPESNRHEVLFT